MNTNLDLISGRNEKWKELDFNEEIDLVYAYDISSHGRIKQTDNFGNQSIVRQYSNHGYPAVRLKRKSTRNNAVRLVHRLLALNFMDKLDEHSYVIHLNFDKADNRIENLKWVTKPEMLAHLKKNPNNKKKGLIHYSKLTESQVKLIKRKLTDPKRKIRMKMLAKQFGVSEMQIYRIKTGENWSHVTAY